MSAISWSAFAHLVGVAMVFLLWPAATVRELPPETTTVQKLAGTTLAFNAKPARPQATPALVTRRLRKPPAPQTGSAGEGGTALTLREQAKQATAAMITSFKFHQIYGFYRDHEYKLAVLTAGEIPPIAAAELPPHFQQYVIIEVTIDTGGQVAEARIVAGIVDPPIQQKLLSAIREFKYSPAQRDGVPIPSQRDIVIRVPS